MFKTFTSKYDNTLSKVWNEVDLKIKGTTGEQIVKLKPSDKPYIDYVSGKYELTLGDVPYAKAVLSTKSINLTAKNYPTVNVDLTPKYILEVKKQDKSGVAKPYKFSIINIEGLEDKIFEGSGSINFAVTPGESYMIKDLETEEVFTASIGAKEGSTTVVLGKGTIVGKSGVGPHTGDNIWLIALGFLAMTLTLLGVRYKKDIIKQR